ncbi:TetR/AcrR family transcriptional regulator [Actinoplanes bogorensis]|uniref:TetR/AcrR family transcriptional regulator n=1 Tax=Paractinoplanes bogorensis TaxID=1610840 RepID=A0ABS5YHA2_9ACTN|nr:TetR/AcrR family transcriptional regulator [Actinoplanes bogorensis]MBU2662777.1 TetR/AcrR family transcriptional regulator [Actinoplanes bogorensis]
MVRADAQRNMDALLTAAMTVFTTSGVDAPAKEIADLAGVGVGTLYRHFPQRSDLIVAVLRHEIDALAFQATTLSVAEWFAAYVELLATKPGFAAALHSGDSAYEALPGYFHERLAPALQSLLDRAAPSVRPDVDAGDLLYAVALLCQPVAAKGRAYTDRMVGVLLDGIRET